MSDKSAFFVWKARKQLEAVFTHTFLILTSLLFQIENGSHTFYLCLKNSTSLKFYVFISTTFENVNYKLHSGHHLEGLL